MAITFVLMITLTILLNRIILAGAITLAIVMAGYIIIVLVKNTKRSRLLNEDCDPQSFIEATEKQIKVTGKDPKYRCYLNIDMAAGLISMGEFEKAKELLLAQDQQYLSPKNGSLLAYTINLIVCYQNLGQMDQAESLFTGQLPALAPVRRDLAISTKLLVAQRFFILGKYEECKAHLQALLKERLNTRLKLSALFGLAQIEEQEKNLTAAKEKYRQIAQQGNRLWVAEEARKRLKAHTN